MASSLMSVIVLFALLASSSATPNRPDLATYKADQAKAQAAKEAAGANEAKMGAVNKVVSMLEDLQQQVIAEGEAEAETYNKFACFCKTQQREKGDSIKTGKGDQQDLQAHMESRETARDEADDNISRLEKTISKKENDMKEDTKQRDATHAVYSTNAADLESALASLNDAIKVMKSSKSPSLLELQSIGKTVKQASLMADALGLDGTGVHKSATIFLQQGDVPMEDYKFHSGDIISTLEGLLNDFRKTKAEVDEDEVKSVKEYDLIRQEDTDRVKALTEEMEQENQRRDQAIEDLSTANQEFTTVSAQLADDVQYLNELNRICNQKAVTWDQRSKLRADELTAITTATGIVKDTVSAKTQSSTIRFAQTSSVLHLADAVVNSDSAMEAIEAETEISEGDEDSPVGFLQKRSVEKHEPYSEGDGRQFIVSLLKGKGQELKSTLLMSLATKIAADPFAKIKKLIQEMIEKLLTEAANESSEKGYCDKATSEAKQRRSRAADGVETLNNKMAKLTALDNKLSEEIDTLVADQGKLSDARQKSEAERKAEEIENRTTVNEAREGLTAITSAIDILDKFYKTSAKAKVPSTSLAQGPLDDAPDAGFDIGEAYTGAAAESGGIVGMMEVIQSDFERTISETNKAEAEAQQDQLKFLTQTDKSMAEKSVAEEASVNQRDDVRANYQDARERFLSHSGALSGAIKELIDLKAQCIDTGMSYADRVALREQEIASLKKALCILGAYAQYGPDGLADAC